MTYQILKGNSLDLLPTLADNSIDATGSGSTGKAAILEGFDFIGIELTEDYWPIIEARLKHAEAKVAERIKETSDQEQEKLF